MCGLVVPIALAHAGCILASGAEVQPPHERAATATTGVATSQPQHIAAESPSPTPRVRVLNAENIVQRHRIAKAMPSASWSAVFDISTVHCGHSLNHYHGQWCGRSWATSCGGCFETVMIVCHCSKMNVCMCLVLGNVILNLYVLDGFACGVF